MSDGGRSTAWQPPTQRPLAMLSAPGSRGDVNPMIAIGQALMRRGFDVLLTTSEPYAALAARAGLQVEVLVSAQRFDALADDPRLWTVLGGVGKLLCEAVADFLQPQIDVIRRHRRPGRTVLVAHPLDFGSRVYRDFDPTVPLASIHLAPALVRSASQPPRMTPFWWEPRRPPLISRCAYWMADLLVVAPRLSGPLNHCRRQLGLPAVRRPLNRWWNSPDLVLGLYPDWYGPPASELPPAMQLVGFPLSDGPVWADDQQATEQMLGGLPAPPVVFTAGTAQRHAAAFFAAAAAACQRLQVPGVLLASDRRQLPPQLPPGVQAAGYLPLGQLLPGAAAVVHHGGIGTTSQALRSACPQLLCPVAFDQFDNAERVVRLGCGLQLLRRPTAERLTRRLQPMLADTAMHRRCAELAAKTAAGGADAAAEAIARLLA